MKRLFLILAVAAHLYAAPPGEQQYRVTLADAVALDGDLAARRLAATYRGRLESAVEAGGVFTIALSGAEAELLRKDAAVRAIEPLAPGAFATAPVAVTGAASPMTIGPYSYDKAGNITAIGTDDFVYDTQNRLVSGEADGGQKSQSYTYDAFGNILTITTSGSSVPSRLGVDPQTNRMDKTSDSAGQPYNMSAGYDANTGNVTSYLGDQFVHDALNVVTKSYTGGVWRAYIYTASDERIGTIQLNSAGTTAVSSEWTFRDSGNQVLRRMSRDTAGNWQWQQDYIYRDGQMLASEVSAPVRRYQYHLDHLGTPRLVTGNGGVELSRHAYYPFGREAATTGTDGERKQFTGHERDAGGIDYMHARYYSPFMGRFLSVDPKLNLKRALRQPQNWNRYSYVMNNPLKYTDPTGEDVSIRLRFQGDGWTEEEKKKIIAQVTSWYQNQNVGKVYVFDGAKASHGGNFFSRLFSGGYTSIAVTSASGAKHTPSTVFAGNYTGLSAAQRINAISNSIIHETVAHHFRATLANAQDYFMYNRKNPYGWYTAINSRYGTVADSWAYAEAATRGNVINGPIPIHPEDRATLQQKLGDEEVEPPDYDQ